MRYISWRADVCCCCLLLLNLTCTAARLPRHSLANFARAIQMGDIDHVQKEVAASAFNASDRIIDRSGRAIAPIEASMRALQQYLALAAARGLGPRPGAAAVTMSSHLSIIALLAKHATADLTTSCPLVLAVHYRIFPAISIIMAASADGGLSCILRRDTHGRTLLHVAAASKAAGLSSLFDPTHSLYNVTLGHRPSVDLLLSVLRLQQPAVPPPELLIRSPTLPRMNANLAAHELHLFLRQTLLMSHHLNARDNVGRAPLHVAASCANAAAVEALVAGGADIDARDKFSRTPLHIACSNRLHNVAEYLLTQGADPDARDIDGNTSLHFAANNHDAVTFSALVRFGANVGILNNLNNSACISAGIARGPDLRAFQSFCGSSAPPDASCAASHVTPALSRESSGGWGSAMSQPPVQTLPCPFEVINTHSSITSEIFISEFVSIQRPVIIRGLGHQAAASSMWTKDAFAQRWGDHNVTVSAVPHAQSYGQASAIMPIRMFLELHMNTSRPTGAYVFDSRLLESVSDLRGDCPPPSLLQDTRIVLSQFFVGSAATGSFPHFHGHALNILVHGKKLWYIFPPNEAHFNVKNISKWVSEDWPTIAGRTLDAQRAGVAQCMQEAGDAVFVPQSWGHAVFNTAPSVGVAYEFDV
jgi:hypothetical protein